MRRLAAVALLAIGIAIPVCAQHGMSHGGGGGGARTGVGGGFAGHSAPSFHGGGFQGGGFHGGGFAGGGRIGGPSQGLARGPVAPHYGGVGARGISRGFPMRNAPTRNLPMRNVGNYGNRAVDYGRRDSGRHDSDHDRRDHDRRGRYRSPYESFYPSGVVYGAGYWPGWIGSDYLGYPDDSGYDDSGAYQNYPDYGAGNGPGDGYDSQPPDEGSQAPARGYQPSAELPRSAPAPQSEEVVTLVFKDGRPAEQIHNYLLSRNTLSVLDKQRRDIPVEQLDVAATEKVNRDAGVDFHLPGAGR
jgi:hypothetical protein